MKLKIFQLIIQIEKGNDYELDACTYLNLLGGYCRKPEVPVRSWGDYPFSWISKMKKKVQENNLCTCATAVPACHSVHPPGWLIYHIYSIIPTITCFSVLFGCCSSLIGCILPLGLPCMEFSWPGNPENFNCKISVVKISEVLCPNLKVGVVVYECENWNEQVGN